MTSLSQKEIRKRGLKALAKELGPVGMARFLAQFDSGSGNYTKERHQWLDELELNDIVEEMENDCDD